MLKFFLHLLSVLFHCVKLAVLSCFYIYLEWLCTFLSGCSSAVLDLNFVLNLFCKENIHNIIINNKLNSMLELSVLQK